MKTLVFVASLLVPIAGVPMPVLACGESIENGVISVQQKATILAKADAALLRFSLTAESASSELASKSVAAKGEDFSKQLKAKFPGLKHVEVSTPSAFAGNGDMPPWMAERMTEPVKPTASVRVTVLMNPDPKDVVKVTDLARSFNAKTQAKYRYDEETAPAQYGLLDPSATEKPLRDKVLKDSRQRAEFWAAGIGKGVGEVKKMELACGSAPESIAVSDSGKSSLVLYYPGVAADAIKVETTATLVYALTPITQ
jgi:uncharacterized protein YggE